MQQAVVAYNFSRWDDDVVFRNQARGTENKGKKEFVNVCSYGLQLSERVLLIWLLQDLLRSDFHKRFMVRRSQMSC